MGNTYLDKKCFSCDKITTHRIRRRFGKADREGVKRMRREVSRCLACNVKVIDNKRKSSGRTRRIMQNS